MSEEEIDLDFNKLNIDIESRRIPRTCEQKPSKDLPEERELHRLSFSGEACPRKSCPCNTKHTLKSTQLCTSWSRRSSQLSKPRLIIQRSRLKNKNPILRNPVLKLTTTLTKNNIKFIKLDMKPENLFKENTTIKLVSNLKLQKINNTNRKFGERTVNNNMDFKSLNVKSEGTIVNSGRYSSHSFRGLRSTRRTPCQGVNLEPQQSCSQQARNVREDITINELASYFENLVHIPKKMSSMAEQMYT